MFYSIPGALTRAFHQYDHVGVQLGYRDMRMGGVAPLARPIP